MFLLWLCLGLWASQLSIVASQYVVCPDSHCPAYANFFYCRTNPDTSRCECKDTIMAVSGFNEGCAYPAPPTTTGQPPTTQPPTTPVPTTPAPPPPETTTQPPTTLQPTTPQPTTPEPTTPQPTTPQPTTLQPTTPQPTTPQPTTPQPTTLQPTTPQPTTPQPTTPQPTTPQPTTPQPTTPQPTTPQPTTPQPTTPQSTTPQPTTPQPTTPQPTTPQPTTPQPTTPQPTTPQPTTLQPTTPQPTTLQPTTPQPTTPQPTTPQPTTPQPTTPQPTTPQPTTPQLTTPQPTTPQPTTPQPTTPQPTTPLPTTPQPTTPQPTTPQPTTQVTTTPALTTTTSGLLCPASSSRRRRSMYRRAIGNETGLDACDYPGMVALVVPLGSLELVPCSGVLTSDTELLIPTACHNFYYDNVGVYLTFKVEAENGLTTHTFTDKYTFNDNGDGTVTVDIPAGSFSSSATCNTIACVYDAATMEGRVDFNNCRALGYGNTSGSEATFKFTGDLSSIPITSKVGSACCESLIAGSQFSTEKEGLVTEASPVCLKSQNGASCGDNGGPIFCTADTGEQVVVALTSGYNCKKGNFFTAIDLTNGVYGNA